MLEQYTSDENFNQLIKKVEKISKKGYIKGISNNYKNSCGLTLENELGKKADSMFFPDFKDIEIKCKQSNSGYNITLFSLAFDGPYLYESNYILNKYGKDDPVLKGKKNLYTKLKYKEKVFYNNYFFELNIDKGKKIIYVNIYDQLLNFLEKRCYISFDLLESRINIKLSKLAFIKGYKKRYNDDLYFKYYKITCLNYKGFDNFLKLIESGDIKCSIMLRYARTGAAAGKNKSRSMLFSIRECDLCKMYDKVYEKKFTY